ncbi:hypothetical protein [Neisseria meningitidis]|uniref:hypothetical protein n=2 Tax=Neisseria meningitidis TaxID=487 RepID=UPI00067D321C|nr:hypothetical protein [Neisseria meningitidis]
MAGLETVSDGIFIGLNLNQDKATKPQTVQAGDEAADSTNRATPVLVFVNPLDKATKPQTVQAGDEAADSTNRATPVLVFVNPL